MSFTYSRIGPKIIEPQWKMEPVSGSHKLTVLKTFFKHAKSEFRIDFFKILPLIRRGGGGNSGGARGLPINN